MDKTNRTYNSLKKESIRLMNALFDASENGQLTSVQLHSLWEIFGSLRQLEMVLKANEKWEKYKNRTRQKTTELIKKHKTAFMQAIQKHIGRMPE